MRLPFACLSSRRALMSDGRATKSIYGTRLSLAGRAPLCANIRIWRRCTNGCVTPPLWVLKRFAAQAAQQENPAAAQAEQKVEGGRGAERAADMAHCDLPHGRHLPHRGHARVHGGTRHLHQGSVRRQRRPYRRSTHCCAPCLACHR